MKLYTVLGLFFLAACSNTNVVLSSKTKVVPQMLPNGIQIRCAQISEWNVQRIRRDGGNTGCWCMLPPAVIPNSKQVVIMFGLSPDEMCTEQENTKSDTSNNFKL